MIDPSVLAIPTRASRTFLKTGFARHALARRVHLDTCLEPGDRRPLSTEDENEANTVRHPYGLLWLLSPDEPNHEPRPHQHRENGSASEETRDARVDGRGRL